ncbi:MAG: NfeD family protein [Anaerolineae bacterium]
MIIALTFSIAGLLLIYLEFFLPGGVFAVAGGAFLIISALVFFSGSHSLVIAIFYLLALTCLTILTCRLALWHLRKSRKFYLKEDQEGFKASSCKSEMIGKIAEVLTDLKPSGHILVEGEEWQAVSQSGYISKGASVEIVGLEGAHYIVTLYKGLSP